MKITIRVPATSANLGPGFDSLGLALDLWNEAEFIPTNDRKISLTIEGEGRDKLPTDANNAIVDAALQVYTLAGKSYHGMQIRCTNRVPLGSGLGSSSAALLTGMLGANAILGEPFSRDEILKLAIETEGHPDNVAPAMLGGLVASIIHESHVVSLRITLTDQRAPIHITVVFPDFDFPTNQARAILPRQMELKDAIYNISRAVIVTEAFRQGDLNMLHEAMSDKLHQPYRLPLIPGAQAAMDAAKGAGASAVALSGAGPSLIAFSSKPDPAVGEAMKRAFEAAGLQARVYQLKMSDHGAEVHIR
ncbi:MAG TPA: homoserine kinase [Anaerolineales bacterium]|nr:homoserine kinase [Anaerolineales bacterium]